MFHEPAPEPRADMFLQPATRRRGGGRGGNPPGVTLTRQARPGRPQGVAVSRVDHQVRFDYIFDAKTYDFLGERVVVVGNLPPYPKGVVSVDRAARSGDREPRRSAALTPVPEEKHVLPGEHVPQ
ncbi:hypothetical protein ACQPZX_41135 [Actinoplanes sp. CA-142083]|uniref:hypothetical protein n=1 Tax=Actinoplanes sp. CA-142083 TaxID=3239903 RepID=UPI003D8A3D51